MLTTIRSRVPNAHWVPHFWPVLPEVGISGHNSSRKPKFHCADRTRHIPYHRFGQQQVYVLRHYHRADDDEPVAISHLLQNLQQKIAAIGSAQPRLTIKATPGNEVQSPSLMEALQAPRHAARVKSRKLFVCDSGSSNAAFPSLGDPTSGKTGQKWGTPALRAKAVAGDKERTGGRAGFAHQVHSHA